MLGAPRLGQLQPLRARLAHPHRLDAAGVCGGDLEQPVDAGPDDEEGVARVKSRPVLGPQHAAQGLDERRRDRIEVLRDLEQLCGQLLRDPHPLGEPAGIEARGPEALTQRLVAAPAAPALAAGRVMVDGHRGSGRRRARPRADRADRPDELVPEHRGQPGGDVPVGHIGRAHPAGEHLADDLARTRLRVLRVLDPDVAGRIRTSARPPSWDRRAHHPTFGDERRHQRRGGDVEGRVAHARAGEREDVSGGRAHLVGVALLDRDVRPVGVAGSIVRVGPATTNGIPAACAASARP